MSSSNAAVNAIVEAYHLIRRRVDARLRADGLSLSRMKLLGVLERSGPMRPGLVASQLNLAPRSVTDAVDALARDGLLERRADPSDRRAQLIVITREGKRSLRTAQTLCDRLVDEAFASVSQARRETLVATLAEIRGALELTD